MISDKELRIMERAIKVSAYSDDDALLILKRLLIEKNGESLRLCDELEESDVEIYKLRKENAFLKETLAKFEGVQVGGSD